MKRSRSRNKARTLGPWGLAWIAVSITGCAGPERGWFAEGRGRTQARHDALEEDRPETPPDSSAACFPLFLAESGPGGTAREVLWPLVEWGRGAELESGTASWLRVRPFVYWDSFARRSRFVIFPFYFRSREELEVGTRSVDHLWPIHGVHREWIDGSPAVTHHVLFPLFSARQGTGQWKVRVFPLFDASKGYLDRGWWLLPLIKSGARERSSFFYLLDPLLAYERDSIALRGEEEPVEKRRIRISLLGGLLGWEDDRGKTALRVLWWIRI